MNILKSLKITSILRMLNSLVVIGLYKTLGIDWVIIYSVINIDAHLDMISEKLDKVLKKGK